jgi:hypothetical protein
MDSIIKGNEIKDCFVHGNRVRGLFKNGVQFYDKQYPLTNLIPNGSFEVNANGWAGNSNPQRVAVPTIVHGEFGSWCGYFSGNVNTSAGGTLGTACYSAVTPNINVKTGDIYYLRCLVRIGNNNVIGAMFKNGIATNSTVIGSELPMPTINEWKLLDTIWTADVSSLQFALHFNPLSGNMARVYWFDNAMLINLTAAFYSGFEPEIIETRSIVKQLGDYWDGTKNY